MTLQACPILICFVRAAASTHNIKRFVQDSIPLMKEVDAAAETKQIRIGKARAHKQI